MHDEHYENTTILNQSLFYDDPIKSDNQLIQTIKLFDGFFLGNAYAGTDEQFICNNKIGLIINCQPLQLKIETFPMVSALNYNFHTRRGQIQQSLHMATFTDIANNIEDYLHHRHQSVLILSIHVDSRNVCLAIAYLMAKFAWNIGQSLALVKRKKKDIQIADKYKQILENFESSSQGVKIRQIFQGETIKQQQTLIKNTIINAQINKMRNFHGLCYKRAAPKQTSSEKKPALVKFIDEIQQINPKTHSPQKNDKQLKHITLTKLLQSKREDDIPKEKPKLNSIQLKLRKYIRQKCHSNNLSGHIEPRVGFQLPGQEPLIMIKAKDRVGRRRAASRIEESTDNDEKKQLKQVKKDNFLQQSLKNNISGMQQLLQKRIVAEQSTENSRLKSVSECDSRSKLAKRWQTEMTQSIEYSQQDISKVNKMFKISQSNKSSHKKLRSNYPQRGKAHPLKALQRNNKSSNIAGALSEKNYTVQTAISVTKNQKKLSIDTKYTYDNNNTNNSRIKKDYCMGIEALSTDGYVQEQRKKSSKLKCRIIPKRLAKQSCFQ